MSYRGDYDAADFDAPGDGTETPPDTEATYNYRPGTDPAATITATFAGIVAGTDPGSSVDPIPTAPAADGATVYVFTETPGDNTAGIRLERDPAATVARVDLEAAWLTATGEGTATGPTWPDTVSGFRLIANPPPWIPPVVRTRPEPAPYSPGDWWRVTGAGTIYGEPVAAGDRLYPYAVGRFYSEDLYGTETYGGEAPEAPWDADPDRVLWLIRDLSNAPAWDLPPGPFTGCPFGDTGWRIAVEAFYSVEAARRYGSGSYGSDDYGGEEESTTWQDITPKSYGMVLRYGGVDGSPIVDVDAGGIDFSDPDAALFPMFPATASGEVESPTVGTPLRVSLVDPDFTPWPIYTGRIETARDPHNGDARSVAVESFGMVSDTAVVGAWDRGPEEAAVRLAHLTELAGYSWGTIPPPATGAPLQRTGEQTGGIREELDAVAISAGLSMDSDTSGRIRFLPWPYVASSDPAIETTDRKNDGPLAVNAAGLVADSTELLNVAAVSRAGVPAVVDANDVELLPEIPEYTATATDALSVGRFGIRDEVVGLPLSGLQCSTAAADAMAAAVAARYGRVMQRLETLEVDTATDPRWLAVLAAMDRGRAVNFKRTKPNRLRLSGIVVGAELRITPGRISATINLTTTTETTL